MDLRTLLASLAGAGAAENARRALADAARDEEEVTAFLARLAARETGAAASSVA